MLTGVVETKDFEFLMEFPRQSLYFFIFIWPLIPFFHYRLVRKRLRCSSPPCPQIFWGKLNWVGEREGYCSERNTVQIICSFFNNNIHCDRKLMKIVPITKETLIISYT